LKDVPVVDVELVVDWIGNGVVEIVLAVDVASVFELF